MVVRRTLLCYCVALLATMLTSCNGGKKPDRNSGSELYIPDDLEFGKNKGGSGGKQKRTISSFAGGRSEGFFSHDLTYTYTGSETLAEVDLTITIWYDLGSRPEVKRFWAIWSPNEQKTVNVTADLGIPQKHKLSGKARIKSEEVLIDVEFSKKPLGQ